MGYPSFITIIQIVPKTKTKTESLTISTNIPKYSVLVLAQWQKRRNQRTSRRWKPSQSSLLPQSFTPLKKANTYSAVAFRRLLVKKPPRGIRQLKKISSTPGRARKPAQTTTSSKNSKLHLFTIIHHQLQFILTTSINRQPHKEWSNRRARVAAVDIQIS